MYAYGKFCVHVRLWIIHHFCAFQIFYSYFYNFGKAGTIDVAIRFKLPVFLRP